MKSTTWDYDKKLITDWLRLGSCNHCGECCQVTIYVDACGADDNDRRNGGDSASGEGQWHQHNNLFWGNIKITEEIGSWNCYEGVAEDGTYIDKQGERQQAANVNDNQKGRCNHERKKGLCAAWPLHPDHVNEFDNCSYRFLKLNEWGIEEAELEEEKQEVIE